MQAGGRWHFDSAAGAQAISDRRIGENEITAIGSLLAVADAERAYFDLRHEYARRFLSSPGQQDGLYWPTDDDAAPARWPGWRRLPRRKAIRSTRCRNRRRCFAAISSAS